MYIYIFICIYIINEKTNERIWYPKELVNVPKADSSALGTQFYHLKKKEFKEIKNKRSSQFACPCQMRNLRDPPTISSTSVKIK